MADTTTELENDTDLETGPRTEDNLDAATHEEENAGPNSEAETKQTVDIESSATETSDTPNELPTTAEENEFNIESDDNQAEELPEDQAPETFDGDPAENDLPVETEALDTEAEPEEITGDINPETAEQVKEDPTEPQKFKEESATVPDTTPPSTLANRFDIYPGRPLPEFDSPSARAFMAEDRMQPQLKLFALICIPGLPVRWEEMHEIAGKMLPGNIALASYGNIDWPILGQKSLAMVFERPLGGRVADFLKSHTVPEYKKIDALRLVLETGMKALVSLQERALTHRGIRPDNIFFTDTDHEEIIFGEFVSSPPGFDQPIAFETIERSMADEAGRGAGTLSEDFYALGASLAMLLQRQNPLRGKSREQVILAKISQSSYQLMIGNSLLTAALLEPIRGLVNDNIDERWGFEELELWLSGRRVTPPQTEPTKKAQRPLKFGDYDHTLPRTLAFSLAERRESAIKLIKDGSISQWYLRGLEDNEMASEIDMAIEISSAKEAANEEPDPDADEILLSRILMMMDPFAPITYKNIKYMPDGYGPAMAVEVLRGGNVKDYAESVINGVPGIWYEISDESGVAQFTELSYFAKISGFLQKAGPGFGLERCLYETNLGYSCRSPMIAAENIFSIGVLLATLNAAEKTVDTKKSPIDRHVAAFIASRSEENMDTDIAALGDLDETTQTLAMLRILVHLQETMKIGTLLGLTKWVGGLMGPVIKLYHSRATRKDVEAEVPRIVRSGNLSELLTLLDDPVAKQTDEANYQAAVDEFGEAEAEIIDIEENTGPGSEAADRTSKQVAAITSILIMIFVISMLLMAGI